MTLKEMKLQATSIEQVQGEYLGRTRENADKPGKAKESEFGRILNRTVVQNEPIRFSKHANARLDSRGIEMTTAQMNRLNEAKNRASEKGIQDSLIMIDRMAFIVNVPNNTVVTAMDQNEAEQNIFTNIDGAIIG